MNRNTTIKLKAAFMLVVFGTNIIVGFACALGIDMGFNQDNHHCEKATSSIHGVDEHPSFCDEADNCIEVNHHDQSDDANDNCCKDKVTRLAQLDKSVPQSYNGIHPVFFIGFVSAFYKISISLPCVIAKDIKQFVRSYHPPIPDIRIAIQYLQI